MGYRDEVAFSDLTGKTLVRVDGLESGSERVEFICVDGDRFVMYHSEDCCERVTVEDVAGDVSDLSDAEVLVAEESSNQDDPPPSAESWTWTFYRITTPRGLVVIRWLGESNGYYSETPIFEMVLA